MKARFRDNIEDMSGYTPGEQPQGVKLIKLNTNMVIMNKKYSFLCAPVTFS